MRDQSTQTLARFPSGLTARRTNNPRSATLALNTAHMASQIRPSLKSNMSYNIQTRQSFLKSIPTWPLNTKSSRAIGHDPQFELVSGNLNAVDTHRRRIEARIFGWMEGKLAVERVFCITRLNLEQSHSTSKVSELIWLLCWNSKIADWVKNQSYIDKRWTEL